MARRRSRNVKLERRDRMAETGVGRRTMDKAISRCMAWSRHTYAPWWQNCESIASSSFLEFFKCGAASLHARSDSGEGVRVGGGLGGRVAPW